VTRPTRPAICIVAAATAALALAACNREDTLTTNTQAPVPATSGPPPTATTTPAIATTTAPPITAATTPPTTPASTAPPSTATPPPDANALLMTALDALTPGYHFRTTTSVGDQVPVSAEGDHASGATRMTVTSGGTATEYIVTPAASWALSADVWLPVASAPGLANPIGRFRAPTAVELIGQDANAATLVGHFPASALGVAGETDTVVTFAVVAGQVTSLSYRSVTAVTAADGTVSEQPATVTTVVTPLAAGTQVTTPPA
jgi:hypothetical protein